MTSGQGGVAIERRGFGEVTVDRGRQTAAAAQAAQSQAIVQARFIVALQRPRDLDDVRVRLLAECRRPKFAKRAYFSLPKGDKPGRLTGIGKRIEGLTVRFVESALRIMGNVWQQTTTLYEDEMVRRINVALVDLETNTSYDRDITLHKTVERRKIKDGQVALSKRTNSAGEEVYLIVATEDEMLQREGAIISKTFRTEGIRLIPPDILEEAEETIMEVVRTDDAADPLAARKSLADAFAALAVMPSDLKTYLGGIELSQCSPAQLADLRGLYSALRDGDTTWADVVGRDDASAPVADDKKDDAPKRGRAGKAADAIRGQEQAKTTPAQVADALRGQEPKATTAAPSVAGAAATPTSAPAAAAPKAADTPAPSPPTPAVAPRATDPVQAQTAPAPAATPPVADETLIDAAIASLSDAEFIVAMNTRQAPATLKDAVVLVEEWKKRVVVGKTRIRYVHPAMTPGGGTAVSIGVVATEPRIFNQGCTCTVFRDGGTMEEMVSLVRAAVVG